MFNILKFKMRLKAIAFMVVSIFLSFQLFWAADGYCFGLIQDKGLLSPSVQINDHLFPEAFKSTLCISQAYWRFKQVRYASNQKVAIESKINREFGADIRIIEHMEDGAVIFRQDGGYFCCYESVESPEGVKNLVKTQSVSIGELTIFPLEIDTDTEEKFRDIFHDLKNPILVIMAKFVSIQKKYTEYLKLLEAQGITEITDYAKVVSPIYQVLDLNAKLRLLKNMSAEEIKTSLKQEGVPALLINSLIQGENNVYYVSSRAIKEILNKKFYPFYQALKNIENLVVKVENEKRFSLFMDSFEDYVLEELVQENKNLEKILWTDFKNMLDAVEQHGRFTEFFDVLQQYKTGIMSELLFYVKNAQTADTGRYIEMQDIEDANKDLKSRQKFKDFPPQLKDVLKRMFITPGYKALPIMRQLLFWMGYSLRPV
ncbi:MAG: hypothetical protein DRP78_04160, partial [Candidatus Omnitrophota bacterium]